MIYLDHAASTPLRPEVREALAPHLSEIFGNSSGVHEVSRRAKNALEEAREKIAEVLGASPREIVFTSGGTESDNMALKGAALAGGGRGGVVVTEIEHEAVLEATHFLERFGCRVRRVGVDRQGRVDPGEVVAAVDFDTSVVSVMAANNETGVIQPLQEIVAALGATDYRPLIHTDAVQMAVSEPIEIDGIDLLSISGHKLGAPKGVGVLYVREGTELEPLVHGGGQELGRRSGTHNVAGAVAMAAALEAATADRERFRIEVGAARDAFEKTVLSAVTGSEVNGDPEQRLVQHCNLHIPGIRNESLLVRLDRAGVAASAGSACQSGAATVSHVLEGMGLSAAEARESVRFTFGWDTTHEMAMEAAEVVASTVGELR